ncbi:hypothetical protein PoB_000193500 [Plakobranchus ocellatus]|uniref:Uncharacterized protein n=1 Tax=Plakobranchus ocellatus TaxID=259542 RepID=A0AAV3XYE8_9GAST|nr:hypothetical protein PoB_000193500 [Plakobranchus ocellatus]
MHDVTAHTLGKVQFALVDNEGTIYCSPSSPYIGVQASNKRSPSHLVLVQCRHLCPGLFPFLIALYPKPISVCPYVYHFSFVSLEVLLPCMSSVFQFSSLLCLRSG